MKLEVIPLQTPRTNGLAPSKTEVRQAGPTFAGASPPAEQRIATARGRRISPVASLKNHPRLAFVVALAVAILGVPVAWMIGSPVYYSEAVVRVSPRFVKNLNEDQELEFQSNTQYREFVQQQVNTINRYDIVFDALAKLGERRRLYQTEKESDRRAAERLAMNLGVRSLPDSYLIAIGLEGGKADGLAEIINSVVGVYLDRTRAEEFYASDERIGNIQEERKKLLEELSLKSAEQISLSQEIGVTTFSDSILNPYDQLLIKNKEALEAASRRRIEVEAQLAALGNGQKTVGKMAADAMAEELAVKDSGLSSLKANLNLRRSQLLSKLSGMAPEHPGRRGIERELGEIDGELTRASESLIKSFRSMLLQQRGADVYQAQRVDKDLAAKVESENSRASWFASRYYKALALGDEIGRMRKRIAAIDDRIDFLTLEASAPGFVRLVSSARPPETPHKGGRKLFLGLFLFVALVLGFVAPLATDYFDPRVHAAGELRQVLGFSPIGWILDRRDEPTRHFAQDQLLRLAATFDRERREQGVDVLAFVSSSAGEGTTTLVLDVAQALEKLGVRAIAVEANAFKPDERYRGDRSNPGLIALLDGEATLEKVIVPGDGRFPDRLPVGPGEGRRHPLATIDQLRHVLTELSGRYDIVLLDGPPLLLSADAELLAGLADATLLVVEAGGESIGQIQRAARVLERISPPVVSAVLNRVRAVSEGGEFVGLLKEHQSGRRLPAGKLLSPWLWK